MSGDDPLTLEGVQAMLDRYRGIGVRVEGEDGSKRVIVHFEHFQAVPFELPPFKSERYSALYAACNAARFCQLSPWADFRDSLGAWVRGGTLAGLLALSSMYARPRREVSEPKRLHRRLVKPMHRRLRRGRRG
jgi:hypothetical protein